MILQSYRYIVKLINELNAKTIDLGYTDYNIILEKYKDVDNNRKIEHFQCYIEMK